MNVPCIDCEMNTTSVTQAVKQIQYRAKEDRLGLFDTLVAWRYEVHTQNPLNVIWPATWILDDDGIDLLSKTHPSDIGSAQDIMVLLQETAEWTIEFGQQLFDVIKRFGRARVKTTLDVMDDLSPDQQDWTISLCDESGAPPLPVSLPS